MESSHDTLVVIAKLGVVMIEVNDVTLLNLTNRHGSSFFHDDGSLGALASRNQKHFCGNARSGAVAHDGSIFEVQKLKGFWCSTEAERVAATPLWIDVNLHDTPERVGN